MFICRRTKKIKRSFFDSIYNEYKWSSIFLKYLIFIVLFFVIPTVVAGVFTISYYNKKAELSQEIEYNNMISRCSGIIDNSFSDIYEDARYLSVNGKVRELLKREDVLDKKTIQLATESYETVNDRVCDSIYLYSLKSDYVFSYNGFGSNYFEKFADTGWIERKEEPMPIYRKGFYGNKKYEFLSLITPINYTNEHIGYAVHNIDTYFLDEALKKNLNPSDCFLLTDSKGKVIYATDKALIGTGLSNVVTDEEKPSICYTEDDIYISNSLLSNGLVCVIKAPRYFEQKNGIGIAVIVMIVMFVMIIFAIFLAFIIASNFYMQIQNILNLFKGEQDRILENGVNEFAYIQTNILGLMKKNEQTEIQLTARIEQVRETQRMLMQSQINSHFLMNTLQLINMVILSIVRHENKASYVIKLLSEMLKSSLDSTKAIVPLKEEVAFAEKYMQIVNMRYDNIIKIEWEIQKEYEGCYVPKMMLQPLVENAVKHGLLPSKNEEKIIKVSAYEENDDIYIIVSDNGIGFDMEKQEEVNLMLSEPIEKWSQNMMKKNRFGLDNTSKCLKLIFGDEYGCRVESEQGKGTKIYIKIKNNQ